MQVIEFIVIAFLVGCQLYFCREIIRRTKLISTFLLKKDNVSVVSSNQDVNLLQTELSVNNTLLKEVVKTINDYLRKNKGNAADFHLIKNIVDRHLDTVDEEINHMLPVPLYLGLAATMVGIICGLLSLHIPDMKEEDSLKNESTEYIVSNIQEDSVNYASHSDTSVGSDNTKRTEESDFIYTINHVITSIKYAMACSLLGLLMTTFLSSLVYREAKFNLEKQKNLFLNILQTQLLPHLNEDAVATLMNMQANLQLFNTNFEQNIEGFSDIMAEIHRAFDSQVQLVQQMQRMDMVQMAQFNSNVLAQLQACMGEFQTFTRYLHQMNEFVSKTTELTNSVNAQLEATDAVKQISVSLRSNIDRNQTVMKALQSFLVKVDTSSAIISASNSIDEAVVEAMNTLKGHVNTQVEEIKDYTRTATTELEQLMGREKGQLDKLDKLNNLDKMNDLVRSIQNMSTDNRALTEGLARRIAALSQSIDNIGRASSASPSRIFPSWFLWLVSLLIVIVSLIFIVRTGFNLFELWKNK